MTDKELIKLAQRYLKLEKLDKEYEAKDPETWKETNKIEKIFQRILRKKKKLPKRIYMKIGNYKVSCSVRYGWLNIKKIK